MLSSRLSRLHGAKCVWKAQVLRRNIAPFPAVTIQSAKFSSQDIFPGVHKLVAEKKLHYFNLPEVMDDTEGNVKKWLIKEGDHFNAGDAICEIAYPSMTIEFSPETSGYLAEMLVNEGVFLPVLKPFAVYAANENEYSEYFDNKRQATMDAARLEEAHNHDEELKAAASGPVESKVTPMIMLRQIKHLIHNQQLDAESDFAKKLQSLARAGDKSLTEVFEASFDGVSFNEESFDSKFFLDNAQALIAQQGK